MFLSTSGGEFFCKPISVKQPFAWDVRHLLTTVPVSTSEWWHWWWHTVRSVTARTHSCKWPSHDTGELLHKWPSNQDGDRKDFCADGGRGELYLSTTRFIVVQVWSLTSSTFYCILSRPRIEWIFVSHRQTTSKIHRMHCWIGSAIVFACLNKNKRLVNFLFILKSVNAALVS